LDSIEDAMRQSSDPVLELEPSDNRPALRVQTIATDFLPRKLFPFDHHGPQSTGSAKTGTTGSGRTATHNHDITDRVSHGHRLPCRCFARKLRTDAEERKTGPEQESSRGTP